MKSYDIIVIGSGSGLEISAEASELDRNVAVIDHGPFGGTCLNRGCIPSKRLIHVADVMQTIRTAGQFGVKAIVESLDWQYIIKRTFDEIDSDSAAIEEGNRSIPNITVYRDTARFIGEKVLRVGDEEIQAPTIVIAAGTRPWVPDVPGLADAPYVTSDEVMRLPELPKRMTIVGGGFIAAEMAHFFGSLGAEVTIAYRGSVLLRNEDEDIAQRFTEVYRGRFNVLLNAQLQRVSAQNGAIALEVGVGGHRVALESDVLLMATGRVPNTDLLDVAAAGVEIDERGFVKTDEYLETNVPGVWALGDIVGKYLLKHSANLEAAYVANNLFNPDHKAEVDYHAMPKAVFASPQVASVGLTEQEARAQGVNYATAFYDYYNTAYGSSIEDQAGFVKAIANPHNGEILGCHIIGADASVLIQEVANAMRFRMGTDAITQSIYVHPALPEVVQRAFGMLPMH